MMRVPCPQRLSKLMLAMAGAVPTELRWLVAVRDALSIKTLLKVFLPSALQLLLYEKIRFIYFECIDFFVL